MGGFSVLFGVLMALVVYPSAAFFAGRFVRSWQTLPRVALKLGLAVVCGLLGSAVRLFGLGLIYLVAFVALTGAVHLVLRALWRGYNGSWLSKLYRSGLVPVVLALALVIGGFFNMRTVRQTLYRVESEKLKGDYRVVFLSDVHYGAVQDVDILAEKVAEINALHPDLVILGGDILDESVTRERMQACFRVLGTLESTYGTFYIYGNHDRQRYSPSPCYTEAELTAAVEANGITLLQDAAVTLTEDLQLLGREDVSARQDRLSPEALESQVDPEKFLLVADHQPVAPGENAQLGADLQLSGHTHGGQIFPLAWFTFFYRGYVYGAYAVEDMTMIVSSGIAGWGFPARTQGICEYVVVELTAKA